MSFWRRLIHELGQAWCNTVHTGPRRYFVHGTLGIVGMCRDCKRLHP